MLPFQGPSARCHTGQRCCRISRVSPQRGRGPATPGVTGSQGFSWVCALGVIRPYSDTLWTKKPFVELEEVAHLAANPPSTVLRSKQKSITHGQGAFTRTTPSARRADPAARPGQDTTGHGESPGQLGFNGVQPMCGPCGATLRTPSGGPQPLSGHCHPPEGPWYPQQPWSNTPATKPPGIWEGNVVRGPREGTGWAEKDFQHAATSGTGAAASCTQPRARERGFAGGSSRTILGPGPGQLKSREEKPVTKSLLQRRNFSRP